MLTQNRAESVQNHGVVPRDCPIRELNGAFQGKPCPAAKRQIETKHAQESAATGIRQGYHPPDSRSSRAGGLHQ